MEFKELMKMLPKDEYQEIEVYMGAWEKGAINFANTEKYDYLIQKLADFWVVGISAYSDTLQVVLI